MDQKLNKPYLSRRDFLRFASLASGALVLASCNVKTETPTEAPTNPPPPAVATATSKPSDTPVPLKPTATLKPTEIPVPTATTGATPDANGCVTDWLFKYPEFTKYDPPIVVKVPFRTMNFQYDGETFTNNPSHQLLLDKLGIDYQESYEVPGSEYYTRLNNDLAAGTLPDVFRVGNPRLGQYINVGAVEDITDIFEATASDLVKQVKGYPKSSIWNGVRKDGRIYGVAYLEDGFTSDNLAFIRSDWLEQVGMQAPKTVDEVTAVAKAIKEKGLCQFPIAMNQELVTWQCSVDPIIGAFGAMSGMGSGTVWWLKNPDGTLRYGSLDAGVKSALAVLNQWFKDELVDTDFINKDASASGDAVLAGQAGIFYAPWWIGQGLLPDVYAAFPGSKVDIIPLPTGPEGKKGRGGTGLLGNALLFRKGLDPKIIEASIKQLNWHTEMHVNWDQYQAYGEAFQGAFFFRGYEWDLDAQCNMVLGPIPDSEWRYQQDLMWNYRGVCYPDYQVPIFQKMAEWQKADPAKLNSAQKFIIGIKAKQDNMTFFNYAVETRDEIIPNEFLGSNTEAISNVLSDLQDYERTTFLEIITGSRPLDDFDKFTTEWLDRGGKIYTEEVNKWYSEQK
jgi:putative aldouronate transport system substrate-binding protein